VLDVLAKWSRPARANTVNDLARNNMKQMLVEQSFCFSSCIGFVITTHVCQVRSSKVQRGVELSHYLSGKCDRLTPMKNISKDWWND
jgi:hypothetical protein